jgi:hypothetical protein
MPAHITIITPIRTSNVEDCRSYLRDNTEPRSTPHIMHCNPTFRFDLIPSLHFASFLVLDAERDFGPNLVFEATFDGSREDFLSDFLRVAANGIDDLYQHCVGYPRAGLQTPQLVKEYFLDHDAGAHIFFSGSPGRTAAQIKDEHRIHATIVRYFSELRALPPRMNALFDALRGFVSGKASLRWAEQQAPVPWEVRFRTATAATAGIAGLALACMLGAILATLFGWWPSSLLDSIKNVLESAGQFGNRIVAYFSSGSTPALPSTVFPVIGLIAIWLLLRAAELFLSDWSKHPRDQFFIWRVPLHLAAIFRYAALVFLAGAVLRAFLSQMGVIAGATDLSVIFADVGRLFILAVVFLVLQHWATSLRISVELKKLSPRRENWHRLLLDLAWFAMTITFAGIILVVSRYLPSVLDGYLTTIAEQLVYVALVIATYGLIGVLAAYGIGVTLLLLVRARELRDSRAFGDPTKLLARAEINTAKYTREEGGNNRLQNHLASVTRVKPGFMRSLFLRATLSAINILSRFWFNVGTLGDIPTILSARWVLIDGGQRLLFLDNYGGAWDSYLNEFIDMTAVKGLNAIWSNTFVEAEGQRYSFPATRFYFWQGAQAEQPFKAYVRQSQVETLAWYSAYPTLSVVNINTSSAVRQSLSKQLASCEVDAIVQNL